MDVEGRFVWIPVRMVLIVRRCVSIYRGPKAHNRGPKELHGV